MALRALLLSLGWNIVAHALALPLLNHSGRTSGVIVLGGFASSYWPLLHDYPADSFQLFLTTLGWLLLAWLGFLGWLRLRGRPAAWVPVLMMVGLWLTWGVLLLVSYAT